MKKERLFIKCELKRDTSHCDFLEHDNGSNKKALNWVQNINPCSLDNNPEWETCL